MTNLLYFFLILALCLIAFLLGLMTGLVIASMVIRKPVKGDNSK